MTDGANPTALLEGAHDGRADRNAADLLDLAARDRLPVGDQRERLEQRARVTRWPLLPETRDDLCSAWAHLDPPAARHFHQLHTALRVVGRQQLERLLHLLGRRPLAFIEVIEQLLHRDRPAGRQQRRFDDVFELVFVHLQCSGFVSSDASSSDGGPGGSSRSPCRSSAAASASPRAYVPASCAIGCSTPAMVSPDGSGSSAAPAAVSSSWSSSSSSSGCAGCASAA